MHSATMKMSEAEFTTYAEAMKGLQDDPLFMCHIPDAQKLRVPLRRYVNYTTLDFNLQDCRRTVRHEAMFMQYFIYCTQINNKIQ